MVDVPAAGEAGSTVLHAQEIYPELPEMDHDIEGRVPMFVLEQVADRHAQEIWGSNVARDAPFPVTDAEGRLIAYVFSYARGRREHPSHRAIYDELSMLRANAASADVAVAESARRSLSDLADRFGAIYVSATARRYPILLVRHHLHPYFLAGQQAQEEAAQRLGRSDVRLERIRFVDAADESLEFVAGDDRAVVPARRDRPDTRTAPLAPGAGQPPEPEVLSREPTAADTGQVWHRLLTTMPRVLTAQKALAAPVEKRIQYWELVPPVPYTWWCVPTAYNMVMGFWDHYVPGIGSFSGHGRVIDHWYEHPTWAHRDDGWDAKVGEPGATPNNVPTITDELVDPTTGTWRTGFNGFVDFVDKTYHYAVALGPPDDKKPNAGNDWEWADIVGEVAAGRPFIWCFAEHAVVGIGYRIDSAGQKYVIYLDTYGATLGQKLKELPYDKGNGFTWLVPGAGDAPENVTLMAPRGGEATWASTPAELTWCDCGVQSTSVALSFSEDAGRTWAPIASAFPAQPGMNAYRWLPHGPEAKARVRSQIFTGTDYLAGDGSLGNVPVTLQAVGGQWTKIFGPVGVVVAGYDKKRATRAIYVTDLDSGDVFQFEGKPDAYYNWFKIGGPGTTFVLDGQGKLYGLAPDGGSVWEYSGTPMSWKQIGGPANAIYPDVNGVCVTEPGAGDVLRYLGSPGAWLKVGGPGKTFASDAKGMLYGVSPDGSGVWRYDGLFGPPKAWAKIGGPAANLYARGLGVYATDPQTGDVRFFHGRPDLWTTVGGPGKSFSVDAEGRLYRLSPDGADVWRYDGSFGAPTTWSHIGGAAGTICAGWREVLATDPQTNNLWIYSA